MKIIYNKFLKISVVIIFLFGVSLYFSNNSYSLTPVAYGSSLVSTTGSGVASASPTSSDKISSDIAFLSTLSSLETIKIDTTLFTNKAFLALRDNAIKIEPIEPGRKNPFSPISADSTTGVTTTSNVVTGEPTEITDKTVILNGTINITDGVTSTYFEYGKTVDLGSVVITSEPSLVGAFIKNVLGLTPKTNYFFRACAKINNIATCGEVVSFNTK
jgi:hypothetical protein